MKSLSNILRDISAAIDDRVEDLREQVDRAFVDPDYSIVSNYMIPGEVLNDLLNSARAGGTMEIPSGEVSKKYREKPKIKPPRRKPSVTNKSNRTDYSKNYMKDYREEGKDYQKIPKKLKKWRRKQRNRLKKKMLSKETFFNNPLIPYFPTV